MPSHLKSLHTISGAALAAILALALSAAATQESAPTGGGQVGQPAELEGMTAGQLSGREVWSDRGVQIGTVERVVEDQATGRLYALIATVSMSGTASAHIVIDLADVELRDNGLMAPVSDREAPLTDRYAYTVERFRAVDPERALGGARGDRTGAGDVGAFEAGGNERDAH